MPEVRKAFRAPVRMSISQEELVVPSEQLRKILDIIAGAKASKKKPDAALLKRIVRAANRGVVCDEEDWAFITEKEKSSPTFIAEQDAITDLDDPKSYWLRKHNAQPKPKPWYNEPPAGHPHSVKG